MTALHAHTGMRRPEMDNAVLHLGGDPISLSDYATTGLLALAVAPRGQGKTNAGLLIAEQLSSQGWVSVLVDPEDELQALYGAAVKDVDELTQALAARNRQILVVAAADAAEFVPYGQAILQAADDHRKPLFLMIDEGQLFSAARRRKDSIGDAADLINQFAERGRKRRLDMFVTAHRFAGSLHRSIFANKNFALIGCQEDPTVWATLAPQFRSSSITFSDVNALEPGEFFCFSRRGVAKIKMPMADALAKVAPKATPVKRALPSTFGQWDRAMREIPTSRLLALADPVVSFLGSVAGLSTQQMLAGANALHDEIAGRS